MRNWEHVGRRKGGRSGEGGRGREGEGRGMEGEGVARVTRGLGSWERELGWGTGEEEERSMERREGSAAK